MIIEEFESLRKLESAQRFIIKIRIGKNVDTFAKLLEFSSAFQQLDALSRLNYSQENYSRKENYLRKNSLPLRAEIINLHIGSEPELTIVTTITWLGILLASIANYDKFKKNIPEIFDDVSSVLNNLKGLTASKRNELENAISLYISGVLQLPEEQLRKISNKILKIRYRLVFRCPPPEIEIIAVDNNEME